MKTEIDRICGIMYTLLEHQPVIDVPHEKINDIAVALVKEGYGKVSEYETEREMLGSKIKVLEQRLNNKYIEIDNLNRDYRNSFERLKAQEREIEKLREDNIDLKEELYELHDDLDIARAKKDKTINQAKIEVLNKVKEKLDNAPNGWAYTTYIDELIEEVENENNSKTNIPRFI